MSFGWSCIDWWRFHRLTNRFICFVIWGTDWATETLKIKTSSNFINHADECPKRPPAQSWEQYEIARERKRKNLSEFPITSDPSLFEAEQEMMQGFIQRGIDNPANLPPTVAIVSTWSKPLSRMICLSVSRRRGER
jgi:hypothetical protein